MKKYLPWACLILYSSCAWAETEFKIITLQHRFASDLLPAVDQMIGEQGSANAIDNQLILRTTPERMRDIEALVSKMDTARINRRITVSTGSSLQSEQTEIAARGTAKVGKIKITVSNDRQSRFNTGRVEVEQNRRDIHQTSQQFISVMDGERAYIRTGQIIPFTQEWITLTRRYVQVERFSDWREISTGFAVQPRTIGDSATGQIELEITPRIARTDGQGILDFEELSTVVRTSLGAWVDLGGTMQQNDDVSRKILGFSKHRSDRESSLNIRVD
ncbi:MAG TPA: nodulation protein NolW [Methylophilus sp.]|nr:nodulation protein NolW [Methylophilus sp.]HQQ34038.1 nodulation protein NolW [Methylophilus sp.]